MAKILGIEPTTENLVIAGVAIPVAYFAYRSIRATKAGLDALGSFVERRERDNNLFHAAANGVTEVVTLDRNQTLGGLVFDLTHKTTDDGRVVSLWESWFGSSAPRDELQTIDVDAIAARRL